MVSLYWSRVGHVWGVSIHWVELHWGITLRLFCSQLPADDVVIGGLYSQLLVIVADLGGALRLPPKWSRMSFGGIVRGRVEAFDSRGVG